MTTATRTEQTTDADTYYVVVDAPGHYGDRTRVMSTHRTLDAARRAAGKSGRLAVYAGARA
jgi:hypothetical protein